MTTYSTQVYLTSRPVGWPSSDNFATIRTSLPTLSDGEIRVENEYISVDPYMRVRMSAGKSYTDPYEIGQVMTGSAIGRVIDSTVEKFPEGTVVSHRLGWRDIAQGPAEAFHPLDPVSDSLPLSIYLGLLGVTGMTAYVGLTRIAKLQEGESVFVSGAAGAVGTAVGQFARLLGASKVYGSTGGTEKCRLITDKYGFDEAIDYKAAPIRKQVNDVIGDDGLDVYFDNVGGDHLEAAIDVLAPYGRIALCGIIGQINDPEPQPGLTNVDKMLKQKLQLQGFVISDYIDEVAEEFHRVVGGWYTDGKLVYDETVVDGIHNSVDAFLGLLRGENTGKMLVKI